MQEVKKPGVAPPANDLTIVSAKSDLCEGVNFNFEGLKRVGSVLILHGWVVDPAHHVASIVLGKPDAPKAIDLANRLVRFARPDVVAAYQTAQADIHTHYGFAAIVEDGRASAKIVQLAVALIATNGRAYVESLRVVQIDIVEANISDIFGIIPDAFINAERCQKFYLPIFGAITKAALLPVEACDEVYGIELKNPELSVIVPLHGNTRFELIQIPTLAALHAGTWEVIFAVDDPQILQAVRSGAKRLSRLYNLAIRVVAPTKNLGFSGINNFAAAKARAKILLFLNSDCFIGAATPIRKAVEWLAGKNAGAVGFRLTYSDKTIQHDGMSVGCWNSDPSFLLNEHPRRGLPNNLIPKQVANDEAKLLTAACLMVSSAVFTQVQGFDHDYVRGDFEDSDLCLKIMAAGLSLGIVRDEGIFHLERQTIGRQEVNVRQKITLINSFIYTRKWKKTIDQGLQNLEVVE